jgi:hypothetical protein
LVLYLFSFRFHRDFQQRSVGSAVGQWRVRLIKVDLNVMFQSR